MSTLTSASHAIAQFEQFRQLDEDWDGERAPAPDKSTIDVAIAFIEGATWSIVHPHPTLSSAGKASVEFFVDGSFVGSVLFETPDTAEIYLLSDLGRGDAEVRAALETLTDFRRTVL